MKTTNDPDQTNNISSQDEVPSLSLREVEDRLKTLKDWRFVPITTSIRADFKAKSFLSAAHFILKVAELADTLNHHPDVHLTGYRNLAFDLTTHEAKGLTEKDFTLASWISKEFAAYSDPVQELQKHRDAIVNYKASRSL
jgi:4a-hydroxytetrahydrobiopterin dehydratase